MAGVLFLLSDDLRRVQRQHCGAHGAVSARIAPRRTQTQRKAVRRVPFSGKRICPSFFFGVLCEIRNKNAFHTQK